ncbi:MAG: phosphotransferase family protein [Gaiellaceae bacterium]
MTTLPKPLVSFDEAQSFLDRYHRFAVDGLEELSGGAWSAAFSYRAAGDELVARFGRNRDWFENDREMHRFASADLPIPRVRVVGDAMNGLYFAISERAYGRFLEEIEPSESEALSAVVARLLRALREVPEEAVAYTWRRWLLSGLDREGRDAQWWARISANPAVAPIADAAQARIRELLDACPEKRELVHGDLLSKNVLVAEDLSALRAVFSWKCSARGDSLYDIAWLTFWGTWGLPGIAAIDPWSLLADDASLDAAIRHHCYELHIGATHLCWNTQIDDAAGVDDIAGQLAKLLECGPREA